MELQESELISPGSFPPWKHACKLAAKMNFSLRLLVGSAVTAARKMKWRDALSQAKCPKLKQRAQQTVKPFALWTGTGRLSRRQLPGLPVTCYDFFHPCLTHAPFITLTLHLKVQVFLHAILGESTCSLNVLICAICGWLSRWGICGLLTVRIDGSQGMHDMVSMILKGWGSMDLDSEGRVHHL